ncbi:hypothetical protein N7532_005626 [Penicillium argentinense]|uniref:Uncharacterized protein n=1 Tax=Penicillium argentinense TaxID=1131581 RepID=A0A9W9KA47_9EURO|nr:uncharacterized protein N7532_005626 [Penicillium argentinense]KAJ5098625.1 hypothetical protein N7532_005626 [Penicillium argentinense]
MSSNTKSENILRFPGSTDPKFAAKPLQSQTQSDQKQDESNWGPTQSLSSHMDAQGHLVPDPVSGGGMKGKKDVFDDDVDVFEAMSAETADFD